MERVTMIIDHFKRLNAYSSELRSSSVAKPGRGTKAYSTAASSGSAVMDLVDVSPKAESFKAWKERLNQLPETRATLVAALRAGVQTGTYDVSSELLAERLEETGAVTARL